MSSLQSCLSSFASWHNFLFFKGYWLVLRVSLFLLPSSLFTTTIGSLPSEEQICTTLAKQGQAKRLRTRTFLWLSQQVSEPSWEVRLWRWEFSHSLKMRWTLCFKIGKKSLSCCQSTKRLWAMKRIIPDKRQFIWKEPSWKATLAEMRTYRVKVAAK